MIVWKCEGKLAPELNTIFLVDMKVDNFESFF